MLGGKLCCLMPKNRKQMDNLAAQKSSTRSNQANVQMSGSLHDCAGADE